MNNALTALQEYSQSFYSTVDFTDTNVVASPLGSWLLLASIANNLDYTDQSQLKQSIEEQLHMSVEAAAETAQSLIAQYPALNYEAKSWSTPDLTNVPAAETWANNNKVIPYENSLPTQDEIDKWVNDASHGLIEKFPVTIDEDTRLIIANIIYSKLKWRTRFAVAPASGPMADWGVNNVLTATLQPTEVTFHQSDTGDIYAAMSLKAEAQESVRLVTCLSKDEEPARLLELAHNLDSLTVIDTKNEELLKASPDQYRVKEIRKGTRPVLIEVNTPSWEANSKHNLSKNRELGYQELANLFATGAKEPTNMNASQIAVAKFNKEGFEAAALTSIVVSRCAMPSFVEQTVFELNLSKAFAFVSMNGELPVFSGYIRNATESE